MQALAIVVLAVLGAVLYGIVHDQITVRISLEYFTIGHPPVFPTEDPTLLAFGWGVIATWWAGAAVGILLAVAARAGSRPRLPARDLVRPIALLLGLMAVGALLAGIAGHLLAQAGHVVLRGSLADEVPADRHVAFLTALWTHLASYGFGFLGGLLLALRTWRRRRAPA